MTLRHKYELEKLIIHIIFTDSSLYYISCNDKQINSKLYYSTSLSVSFRGGIMVFNTTAYSIQTDSGTNKF
jgi:hypothetical protein